MAATPILCCSHVAEWGGAETVLADFFASHDRQRHQLHFACPVDGPLVDRARELQLPVHRIPLGGRSATGKLCSLPGAAMALRRLARQIGARALYANSMIAGYAAVLASSAQLPCLWHLHIVTDSRLAGFALRRAHTVIAPAAACGSALHPAVRQRLQIVPNGVADAFFAAAATAQTGSLRAELGLAADARLLGILGRLDPDKGHEVLLQALRQLPPTVHLAVVGAASFADALPRVRGYAERLRAAVAAAGLQQRVHLLGHRSDLPRLLPQLDLLVLPSVAAEAAPRSIAEAMAAGVAVVASAVGGVPAMIHDRQTGHLVPPGDSVALAARLHELLQSHDERSRLAAAARQQALAEYRLPVFAQRISDLLDAAVTPAAAYVPG